MECGSGACSGTVVVKRWIVELRICREYLEEPVAEDKCDHDHTVACGTFGIEVRFWNAEDTVVHKLCCCVGSPLDGIPECINCRDHTVKGGEWLLQLAHCKPEICSALERLSPVDCFDGVCYC